MLYKINNINIINANLFACPYTAGFSLASFKGLVDFLNIKMISIFEFSGSFDKFGIIVNANNGKIKEPIQRDTSTSKPTKNTYKMPAILQNRYFDFSIDLVLNLKEENNTEYDMANFEEHLAFVTNLAKVQAGLINKEIKVEDISSFDNIKSKDLTKNSYALGYIITDASNEINLSQDLIEQYSDKLAEIDSPYMLTCNGYKYVAKSDYKREIELQENVETIFVEPNLLLAKIIPTYKVIKDPTILNNFLFSTIQKPEYFIVSAFNN